MRTSNSFSYYVQVIIARNEFPILKSKPRCDGGFSSRFKFFTRVSCIFSRHSANDSKIIARMQPIVVLYAVCVCVCARARFGLTIDYIRNALCSFHCIHGGRDKESAEY